MLIKVGCMFIYKYLRLYCISKKRSEYSLIKCGQCCHLLFQHAVARQQQYVAKLEVIVLHEAIVRALRVVDHG
jgi:acetyl-CoA carboxylase beta subunit